MNLSNYIKNNRLSIIVKPNSKKTEILCFDKERQALKVNVAAQPSDNQANKELIRFISKQIKKKVLIEKGMTSRQKVLKIIE